MTVANELDPIYVEARRVLLDALFALEPHLEAVIVAGAQAIYLRTGASDLAVAPYTSDGDLTLDPHLLQEREPVLGAAMESAGFTLATQHAGGLEPGIWVKHATVDGVQVDLPVDLIVPAGANSNSQRRGARLGLHGNSAARNIAGLEAVLIDHSPMDVQALDPFDGRSITTEVAGVASLLVAKSHKLHDRLTQGVARRVDDKDASDVIRIMQTTSVGEVVMKFQGFVENEVASQPTIDAIEYLRDLFGRRTSTGTEMAARALRLAMSEETVGAIATSYIGALLADLK